MKKLLKQYIRPIRSFFISWLPGQTTEHLEAIRLYEIEQVLALLGDCCNKRLLEIGGGTGWQAKFLSQRGFGVESIDVTSHEDKVWPVKVYDGFHIPFEDNEFDLVFSSNVLEHIPHIVEFQSEIQRVLKHGGLTLHLVPSSSWRFWTNVTEIIKRWRPPLRHGEHAHNAFLELFYFRKRWWINLFENTGWEIIDVSDNDLFYTGGSLLDNKLSLQARTRMSRVLGSSCHVFLLQNRKASKLNDDNHLGAGTLV